MTKIIVTDNSSHVILAITKVLLEEGIATEISSLTIESEQSEHCLDCHDPNQGKAQWKRENNRHKLYRK